MCALPSPFSLPDAGNRLATVVAAALNDVILEDGKAQSSDDELAAVVAIGVVGRMTRHVANVRVVDAFIERDLMRLLQLRYRSGRQVREPVQRVETAEVERYIRAKLLHDPAAKRLQLSGFIIEGWHHERDDLQMNTLLLDGLHGVQDRLQRTAAYLPIKVLTETLKVDLDRINNATELAQGGLIDVASADHSAAQFLSTGQTSGVEHVLIEDGRLGVGVGDDRPVVALGQRDDINRLQDGAFHLLRPALRDLPVLTVQAVQIAPGGGDGEGHTARKEVIERLLLDGIGMHGTWVAVDKGVQSPRPVLSHTALPAMAVRYETSPGAKLALDIGVGVWHMAVLDSRWDNLVVTGLAANSLAAGCVVESFALER